MMRPLFFGFLLGLGGGGVLSLFAFLFFGTIPFLTGALLGSGFYSSSLTAIGTAALVLSFGTGVLGALCGLVWHAFNPVKLEGMNTKGIRSALGITGRTRGLYKTNFLEPEISSPAQKKSQEWTPPKPDQTQQTPDTEEPDNDNSRRFRR